MGVMEDTSRNLAAVRRLLEEVWGRGAWHLIPELIAHDYVGHFPIGDHYGPEGVRIDVAAYRTAMPDLTVTVEELLEAGDCVIRRYSLRGTQVRPLLDIPATGAVVTLRALAIDRMAGGLLRESWVFGDLLPLYRARMT
jgi:predicted ester cyclase